MATISVRTPPPTVHDPAPARRDEGGASVRVDPLPHGLRRIVLHVAILTLALLLSVLVAAALTLAGSDLGPPLAPGPYPARGVAGGLPG